MGRIFSFFILKDVISSVKKPAATLLMLTLISFIGLALLEDLSTNGLVEIWLALLIKWMWLSTALILALKPLADMRDGLSGTFSFSKKSEETHARHCDLMQKPVLMRRRDQIVNKYRKKR